jgi:hypothetical protein
MRSGAVASCSLGRCAQARGLPRLADGIGSPRPMEGHDSSCGATCEGAEAARSSYGDRRSNSETPTPRSYTGCRGRKT